MRPLAILALFSLVTLPGCCIGPLFSAPHQYRYQVDIRNTSGQPVSVEFLRIEADRLEKVRCDLADGGSYTNSFATTNSGKYLEARLFPLGHPDAPRTIVPITEGQTRADIVSTNNILAMQLRPTSSNK